MISRLSTITQKEKNICWNLFSSVIVNDIYWLGQKLQWFFIKNWDSYSGQEQQALKKWYREYYSQNKETERHRYRSYYALNSKAERERVKKYKNTIF